MKTTLQKTSRGLLIPNNVLKLAGISENVKFIVRSRMLILIPKSFTELTKGLVKPRISIDEISKEYEEYLFKRGLGRA